MESLKNEIFLNFYLAREVFYQIAEGLHERVMMEIGRVWKKALQSFLIQGIKKSEDLPPSAFNLFLSTLIYSRESAHIERRRNKQQ